jgi:hypothetical protein
MVDRFAEDWRSAGLDDATTALLLFAKRLTGECAAVGADDVSALRAAAEGWIDDYGWVKTT